MEPDYQSEGAELYTGDAAEVLSGLPERNVQTVVTSPPYWSLRDYQCEGQIGLEETPEAHVENLVEVFRGVRRVLRDDGTVWLNYGDAYSAGHRSGHGDKIGKKQRTNRASAAGADEVRPSAAKEKDLLGLPWQVAFALRADGWYLRSAIVWAKGVSFCDSYSGSVMPESVNGWRWERCCDGCEKCEDGHGPDGYVLRRGSWRPTSAYEHVFMLAKSDRYFCDAEAVREEALQTCGSKGGTVGPKQQSAPDDRTRFAASNRPGAKRYHPSTRNPRNVWTIGTSGTSRKHYAAFPKTLVEPCIRAGTPKHACAECDAPWVPVVEKHRTHQSGSGRSGNPPEGKHGTSMQGGGATGDVRNGPCVSSNVTGHYPTCTCDAGKARPVVLDPFSGTATTGVVALRERCNYWGIDLSEKYQRIAGQRLDEVITGVPEDQQAALAECGRRQQSFFDAEGE